MDAGGFHPGPLGMHLRRHFSGGNILATHMLMSGSWHIYRPGEPWQEKPRQRAHRDRNSDYVAVGFRIPLARMLHRAIAGPRSQNPARRKRCTQRRVSMPPSCATRLMARTTDELGDVLLRQDVLAGVGNVFKSEICFLLGLNPVSKSSELSQMQARRDRSHSSTSARGQRPRRLKRPHCHLQRQASPHHQQRGPWRKPLGLRPQERALPPLRNTHSTRAARSQRTLNLLVPGLPAATQTACASASPS
jgi:hypothetical protein